MSIIIEVLRLVWGALSDKHTLLISMITHVAMCAIIVSVFFYTPVYNDETPYQLLHRHSKQWQVFNRDSIDNQFIMLSTIDKKIEARIQYERLKTERRDHERDLYELVDDQGNFKSDFKRAIWERRDTEIKMEVDRLQRELDEQNSVIDNSILFAKRDR